jgi:glutaredoxin
MIKVFQAEWCPHSHKIRQRLTELMVPFIAIPVPASKEDREDLVHATGQDSIPAVVLSDGIVLSGKDEDILEGLNSTFPEPPEAEAHKEKAIKNS